LKQKKIKGTMKTVTFLTLPLLRLAQAHFSSGLHSLFKSANQKS
jgi:hypothetical protein